MDMNDTDGVIREAMCKEVDAWMAEVFWDMMGKKLLKNAWWNMEYDWFKGVVEEEGMVGDGNEVNDGNEDNDDKTHNDCDNDNDNEVHDNGEDNEEWEDWEEDGA